MVSVVARAPVDSEDLPWVVAAAPEVTAAARAEEALREVIKPNFTAQSVHLKYLKRSASQVNVLEAVNLIYLLSLFICLNKTVKS